MELLPMLLLFGLLGAMMYFMSRRQRRAVQQQQQLQNSLNVGDRVMTTSGMYGTIVATDDTTIDLEIAPGVETTWLRAAVREKVADDDVALEDEYTVDDLQEHEAINDVAEVEERREPEVAPSLESGKQKS
jgi:preprotein translocase subunit YajC